jgi:phosphate:Na+ symporter
MDSNQFSLSFFLLAIGFFVYGLKLTSEHLKQMFSDQLRTMVRQLTRNRFLGFFFGFMMTLVFQSSAAANALLIGFVSVGIVTLQNAIPVVLGADLSISVLLFFFATFARFNLQPFAQSLLVFGMLAHFLFHKAYRNHAKILMSLGFVFYGLSLMGAANAPLRESEMFQIFIQNIMQHPVWAFLLGLLLSSFLQSTIISLGILISFSYSGMIPIAEAIPYVLGVNLGSSITLFMMSAHAQDDGRYISYANALFKVFGIVLIFPLYPYFAQLVSKIATIPPYQIAWAHVIFNALLVIFFLPFTEQLADLMKKKIKHLSTPSSKFRSQFLDVTSLDSATIAIANVSREISRMASIVEDMCKQLLKPFQEKSNDMIIEIDEMDDQVDQLDREIKFYLARINTQELSGDQSKKCVELLMFTNNLESIGDLINRNIMVLVEKKKKYGVEFSKDAWAEIVEFHAKVLENFKMAVSAFVTGDVELGKKVLRNKKFLTSLEQEFGQHHLNRLNKLEDQELIDALSLFMDVLSNLRLINSFICKMAGPALDRRQAGDAQV